MCNNCIYKNKCTKKKCCPFNTDPVYFNAVSKGGTQDVPPEGTVNFLTSQQSGDFTFAPGNDTIIINKAGTYRIDYEVTLRATDGTIDSAYALVINGVEHPFSYFGMHHTGSSSGRFPYSGFIIAEDVEKGTTVQLRNKTVTVDRLAGTGIDNQPVNRAAIIIQKL